MIELSIYGIVTAPGFPEYSDIGSNPVDIVFVVDTSAFNNETAEDEIVVKAFIAGFLDNADVDSGAVKAAFITYSTHPKVVFDLDDYSDKSEMVDAVYLSEFEEGERNTADALGKVRSQILRQDRPDVPNVIVLIMTGASDRNSFRTLQESDALKVARSTVFVIGVNLDEDGTNELNQLASKPTMDHSFQVTSFSEFDILKDVLFAQIFDWAEQAYNVPATGTESLDVAFLLHFSHTMTSTAHEQILGFMKSVLQYSGLDGDKVKVGAALLRKKGTVLFDLNAHSGQEEVFEAIDKISYTYRSKPANFASGFDTVRTSLFTESRGDRAEVPNLIILITDANSNEDVGGTITAVEKAKAAGAAVFVVGVNVSYAEEMTSVASSSGFTVLVNDTKYLKDQAMTLYDSFVALRTEGFPVVIPAEQTSLTIPAFVMECSTDEYLVKNDSTLSVSSQLNQNEPDMFGADQGRLNSTETGEGTSFRAGIWAAGVADTNQYIQVNFTVPKIITGIETRGRPISQNHQNPQWVTQYRFMYSRDCEIFNTYTHTNGSDMLFDANHDGNTIRLNQLPYPVLALCARVNPTRWQVHISMQFDVRGCNGPI